MELIILGKWKLKWVEIVVLLSVLFLLIKSVGDNDF